MILVHVKNTWTQVLAGKMTPDDSVLGSWAPIAESSLQQHGDVLAGVYNNTVVAAYDIDLAATRYVDGKVQFAGVPSTTWAHLVGQPNPGKPWGQQGYARNVQYLDSAVVASGEVPVEESPAGRRAVVDDVVLIVDGDGAATVLLPPGRTVTVKTLEPGKSGDRRPLRPRGPVPLLPDDA
ncbi:hypothetical protein AB0B10_26245 [Micromonospora arborensis]|uniref:hypothetical protein n=1 Tax=Micromonospora arborensis TaxID=2116518 RepID=UPI0033DB2735